MKKWIHASQNTTQLEVNTSGLDLSQISNSSEAENFINEIINEVESYLASKCPGMSYKLTIVSTNRGACIYIEMNAIGIWNIDLDNTDIIHLDKGDDGSYYLSESGIDEGYRFLDQTLPEFARQSKNRYNWILKKESNDLKGVPDDVISSFSYHHAFLQSHAKTSRSVEDLLEDLEYEYPLNLKLKKSNPSYWKSCSRDVDIIEDYINTHDMSLQEIKTFSNLCHKYRDIKRGDYK